MASARLGFRSRTASSSRNQPYMAVHESIPEEDPPRYKDDDDDKEEKDGEDMEGLLASSDSDAGEEDENAVKLRRRRSSSGAGAGAGLGAKVKAKAKTAAGARRRSGSGGGGGPGSYVPVVRNSGDYETYLDSITEAEQELLSAEHGQEYEDYGERYDVDAEDYEQGYGVADSEFTDSDDAYPGGMKRRRMRETRGPCGIRVYWYSKAFCRSLVALIVCLVLLVLGFVSLARYRKATPAYYPMVPADHRYPTPRGGTIKSWEDSYMKAWDLVRNMTLTEKVNITTGTGWQMGQCVGNTGSASLVGFPSLCLQDGPMGLRYADHITAFPPGLTTGATWNRTLIHERGVALGAEARLKGVNVLLGPSMGAMGMMPAGGRNWEGFGSDPVLQGVASAETIRGIQSTGVMATAKHYVMNEQEHFRQSHEWGIDTALSSNVNDRALHEVFVWPFAESIRADVASVMCAYQMVNNSYACENSKLLNGVLKDELGFQGFVQSDWLAQRSGVNSAISGLDMSMPGDGLHWANGKPLWGSQLTRAVLNTSVPMDRLDDMVTRIVAAWYHFQQDEWEEPGPNFSSWTKEESGAAFLYYGSPEDQNYGLLNKWVDAAVGHSDVARRVAAEGIVLLKNELDTLPLSRTPEPATPYRVGIYGDDAGPASGPNACSDRGCNQGTLASGWGSGTVEFPYLVSPLEALHAAWEPNEDVEITEYLRNAVMTDDVTDKDLCLVFANADGGEGYISAGGIHGDRNDLFLQKGGDTLINTVAPHCGGGNGRTVVVVHSIGPVVVEPWIDIPGVHAVVFANLPGQESGNALADVLFGDVDASGRLPYTIGRSLDDYGEGAQVLYEANAPVPQINFTDGLYMDYRHFDRYNITPRYEFGFGLSYTTFEFSQPYSSSVHWKSPFPDARPANSSSPPLYDPTLPEAGSVLFPGDHPRVEKFIYPYLDTLDGTTPAAYDYPKGYNLSDPAPDSEAGGGLGGNPSLYEEMVRVQVQVANTGRRTGQEVVQVYVSFPSGVTEEVEQRPSASQPSPTPGPDSDPDKALTDKKKGKGKGKGKGPTFEEIEFPDRVLRNFTKVELDPGTKQTVELTLSRKDLSYWSVRWQNWVMPDDGKFRIWVGRSSRDLILAGEY